jgi:hypothetical protein
MVAGTRAVRDYTADDLSPLLQQNPRHKVRFLAETIPFYAATTTFNKVRKSYRNIPTRKPRSTPRIPKTVPPIGRPTSFACYAIILSRNGWWANVTHPPARQFF